MKEVGVFISFALSTTLRKSVCFQCFFGYICNRVRTAENVQGGKSFFAISYLALVPFVRASGPETDVPKSVVQ